MDSSCIRGSMRYGCLGSHLGIDGDAVNVVVSVNIVVAAGVYLIS